MPLLCVSLSNTCGCFMSILTRVYLIMFGYRWMRPRKRQIAGLHPPLVRFVPHFPTLSLRLHILHAGGCQCRDKTLVAMLNNLILILPIWPSVRTNTPFWLSHCVSFSHACSLRSSSSTLKLTFLSLPPPIPTPTPTPPGRWYSSRSIGRVWKVIPFCVVLVFLPDTLQCACHFGIFQWRQKLLRSLWKFYERNPFFSSFLREKYCLCQWSILVC